MWRPPLLLLLLAHAPAAARAAPPHGGGACASDWDCSLGGTCAPSAACACDPWFTGPTCALLNLVAPTLEESQSWGLQLTAWHGGYSTWGGHAAWDAAASEWSAAFSLMCNHGPLGEWTVYSSIVRATSPTLVGAYTLVEQLDVPYATNAMYVPPGPDGVHTLWRVGSAEGQNPQTWSPCFNLSSAEERPSPRASSLAPAVARVGGGNETGNVFVQTAPSASGPWTEHGTISIDLDGSWATGTSNPAPFIFPNGTTLLYFSGTPCPAGWGLAPGCIGVARADSWRGPFSAPSPRPLAHPESEDPHVFRDPRGK